MIPRKVCAIQIDDDQSNHLDNQTLDLSPFVAVQVISTEVGAQRLLADARAVRGELPAIDIVLADVDFSQAPVPKGLDWGAASDRGTGLRPFGPLLLLPFLASRSVGVFVPYSSYWGTAEVLENGYVGVALSLIFSVVEGKLHTIQTALERARQFREQSQDVDRSSPLRSKEDKKRTPESMLNEARDALVRGLHEFRERLINRSEPSFLDIDRTKQRLEAREERACDSAEWPLPVPFEDENGAIALSFLETDEGPVVEIEVSSFFADLLMFRAPEDGSHLTALYAELDRCSRRSRSYRGGLYANYDYACKALEVCRTDNNLKETLKQIADGAPELDWELVRRLAVVFAWVKAWYQGKQSDKSFVHELLGFKITKADGSVVMDPQVTNHYRRLISVNDTPTVDETSHRRPFKRHSKSPYNLDEDGDADLTDIEKMLSRKYAEEYLKWLEYRAVRPYPAWMREGSRNTRRTQAEG